MRAISKQLANIVPAAVEIERMTGAARDAAASNEETFKDMRRLVDESQAGKAMQASILELEQQLAAKDWLLVQLQVHIAPPI